MRYIYFTKKKGNIIGGIIEARHSIEATFNARHEAFKRGADIKTVLINKID